MESKHKNICGRPVGFSEEEAAEWLVKGFLWAVIIMLVLVSLVCWVTADACESPGESPPAEAPAPASPGNNSNSGGNAGLSALGSAGADVDGDCDQSGYQSYTIQLNKDCDSLWEILTDPRCKDE